MNGDTDYNRIISKYYPADSDVCGILLRHSRSVADLALEIAHRNRLPLDDSAIETAAMLHDIGIIFTDAPGIGCHGSEPYLRHGVIGAELLRGERVSETYARVAERHTGAGLTAADVARLGLPLPAGRDYIPETLLERLVCYADCFYSKSGDMQQKSLDRIRAGMARFGEDVLARFEALHRQFSKK